MAPVNLSPAGLQGGMPARTPSSNVIAALVQEVAARSIVLPRSTFPTTPIITFGVLAACFAVASLTMAFLQLRNAWRSSAATAMVGRIDPVVECINNAGGEAVGGGASTEEYEMQPGARQVQSPSPSWAHRRYFSR